MRSRFRPCWISVEGTNMGIPPGPPFTKGGSLLGQKGAEDRSPHPSHIRVFQVFCLSDRPKESAGRFRGGRNEDRSVIALGKTLAVSPRGFAIIRCFFGDGIDSLIDELNGVLVA
jgi:hypothetical protein